MVRGSELRRTIYGFLCASIVAGVLYLLRMLHLVSVDDGDILVAYVLSYLIAVTRYDIYAR